MTEIERKVTIRRKCNAISRLFHSRGDKKKIAAWRSDLNRILHIFNVRLATSLLMLLTIRFQTELALDTNATVSNTHNIISETHNIVSNLHRTMVKRQERPDGRNPPVSSDYTLFVTR